MADTQILEAAVQELIQLYNVTAPPIPIERMLQHPFDDMWDDVDMNFVTSTFLRISTPYSPRMSLARFLARHIAMSPWGEKRGLDRLNDEQSIQKFARVIVMPAELVLEINAASRTPEIISLHFEVPEEDAEMRLKEIAAYAKK